MCCTQASSERAVRSSGLGSPTSQEIRTPLIAIFGSETQTDDADRAVGRREERTTPPRVPFAMEMHAGLLDVVNLARDGVLPCVHGKIRRRCKDCSDSVCEHGRERNKCVPCGGRHICQHGRQRNTCKECGGASICEHGNRRSLCKQCHGSAICIHNRRRCICKECGGSAICEHGALKYRCKDCGGKSICEHGKRRNRCKDCGGGAICEHKRIRYQCKDCGGKSFCKHKRRRTECKDCRDEAAADAGGEPAQPKVRAKPASRKQTQVNDPAQSKAQSKRRKLPGWRELNRQTDMAMEIAIALGLGVGTEPVPRPSDEPATGLAAATARPISALVGSPEEVARTLTFLYSEPDGEAPTIAPAVAQLAESTSGSAQATTHHAQSGTRTDSTLHHVEGLGAHSETPTDPTAFHVAQLSWMPGSSSLQRLQ